MIIYYIRPDLLDNNFLNIFLSSLISIYLNLISILPLNIGYSQMVHGITFNYFSLPHGLAITIATIKQICDVILILITFIIYKNKFFKIIFIKEINYFIPIMPIKLNHLRKHHFS